jgi:Zn-dependent peptidase ImmA (M78 family)
MATLERGFKSWAERTAASIRRELGVSDDGPLDLGALAELIGVRLMVPSEVVAIPQEALRILLVDDPGGWSAVSLTSRERAVVIYNPCHSKARQASDIAHELSHIVLNHEPAKLVVSSDGQIVMRSYNGKQEEEANWLGWSLLLPREALLHTSRQRMLTSEIARIYGVSEALVTFRMGVSGVRLLQSRVRSRFGNLGKV